MTAVSSMSQPPGALHVSRVYCTAVNDNHHPSAPSMSLQLSLSVTSDHRRPPQTHLAGAKKRVSVRSVLDVSCSISVIAQSITLLSLRIAFTLKTCTICHRAGTRRATNGLVSLLFSVLGCCGRDERRRTRQDCSVGDGSGSDGGPKASPWPCDGHLGSGVRLTIGTAVAR